MSRDGYAVTVADIARLYYGTSDDRDLLQRAVRVDTWPPHWRDRFQQQIEPCKR
jgi:hypothetical protein